MQVLQDFHKTLILVCIFCISLSACNEQGPQRSVTAQTLAEAEALLEDAALTEAALDPETSSLWGLDTSFAPSVKTRLSGTSQAAFERERLLRLDLQSRLANAPLLPDDHPLARDLLLTRLALQDTVLLQKTGKGHLGFGSVRPYSIDPYSGLWIEGPQTLVRDHTIETANDAEAYISRLAILSDGLQDTRRRLIADAATGHLPASELLQETRLRLESLLQDDVFISLIETLDDFSRGVSDTSIRDHEARMIAAETIYQTDLIPAYRGLVQTLGELEQQAPIPLGLWTQPGGVTFYNDLLSTKAEPTARADTLWLNLDEAVLDIAVPQPDSDAPTEEETSTLPLKPSELQPTPPEIVIGILREQPVLSTRSFQGITLLPARLDDRRPLIMQWDPARLSEFSPDLRAAILDRSRREAEAQIAKSHQTAATRSTIYAFNTDTAFRQAWTSYYQTLKSGDTGKALINLETILAATDIGLHVRRWSLEDALAFVQHKTGLSERLAEEAVLRIAANPAEAVGVYVHRERFRSLEARARQVLGPDFDLAEFHAILLKDGPRPLPLVERDVDDWYQSFLADR